MAPTQQQMGESCSARNVKKLMRLSGFPTVPLWKPTHLGDDLIEYLQRGRSALESEVPLVRQYLAISETWMEDSMPVNVPGFDLRSSYKTAKYRQIATTSLVVVASSSSRKAGGVAI
ncbi:hypothetical protein TNCV_3243141 [Trichonephila clavipes]|nr:hypothetical protein TNCV_3243141 [Trichonephila clavipes]